MSGKGSSVPGGLVAGKKIESIGCGKCYGVLVSLTDSQGYKNAPPKCYGYV